MPTEILQANKEPADAQVMIEAGYELLRSGRVDEARQHAEHTVARHPEHVAVLDYASEAALGTGDARRALEWITKAVKLSKSPQLKLKKGRLLLQMRRRNETCLAADDVAENTQDPSLLWQAGSLHVACQRFRRGIELYEAARRRAGDHPQLLYDLAVARFFSGQFEPAELDLDRMIEKAPHAGHAWYLRSTLRRQTSERNHIDQLHRRLQQGLPHAAAEAGVLYALSKELEDTGDDEQAMTVLLAAAAKRRSTLQYEIEGECAAMESIRSAYSRQVMDMPSAGCPEDGAIFIVGMPRTGTTLAERMLVQSGKVKAAGELLDFANLLTLAVRRHFLSSGDSTQSPAEASLEIDFAALGADFLAGARESAEGSAIFIDKMPVNFMYCGLIRKALPQARIIHLIRDPLDTCHAILKTLFFDAYPFSYDQRELALYYVAYHRMMRHWHEVMPGQILDVRYEDLVKDPETHARRIYHWCGLEWSPAALETPSQTSAFATASAAQVREPVHQRSLNRARRHRDSLATLVSVLESNGIVVG